MTHTGAMKAHFTLQAQSMIADGYGGSVTQWTNLGTFWGRMDRIDRALRATLRSGASHQVVTRKVKSLAPTAGMQLALVDRKFLIHDVFDVNEDGRWIGMVVEERG